MKTIAYTPPRLELLRSFLILNIYINNIYINDLREDVQAVSKLRASSVSKFESMSNIEDAQGAQGFGVYREREQVARGAQRPMPLRVAVVGLLLETSISVKDQPACFSIVANRHHECRQIVHRGGVGKKVPFRALRDLHGARHASRSLANFHSEELARCQIVTRKPLKSEASKTAFAELLHRRWVTP